MTVQEAKEQLLHDCHMLQTDLGIPHDLLEEFDYAIQSLEEVEQYRALGTVEELKEAKEKQIPKKPELIEDKMWTCPCCDNNLMHKWLKYPTELMPKSEGLPYCMSCGQKLDWEEGGTSESV